MAYCLQTLTEMLEEDSLAGIDTWVSHLSPVAFKRGQLHLEWLPVFISVMENETFQCSCFVGDP